MVIRYVLFRLTVGRHHEEDYDSERPFKEEHEGHESDGNVRKRGHNIENQGLRMSNVRIGTLAHRGPREYKTAHLEGAVDRSPTVKNTENLAGLAARMERE